MHIQRLTEVIFTSIQDSAGICKITTFTFHQLSYRLVTLLLFSDIFVLTVCFKLTNLVSQIFLLFFQKVPLLSQVLHCSNYLN
jgi:hypothetical protein